MGRLLGSHDTDDLDRPDLNKCPGCGSYFAPDDDTCPICGAHCTEEFRAGNRKAVKQKRQTFSRASSRVTFVEWYHSWWFIILALIFFPVIGIVLLITSPHKNSQKITVVVIAVIYSILSTFGIGNLIGRVTNLFDAPVNQSLTREEYIDVCARLDAETFYRSPDTYDGQFVSMTVMVGERIIDSEGYYSGDNHTTYYVCTDPNNSGITILLRDCIRDGTQNFIAGDVITVYGEGAGNVSVYDMEYIMHSAPCVHAAYAELIQ